LKPESHRKQTQTATKPSASSAGTKRNTIEVRVRVSTVEVARHSWMMDYTWVGIEEGGVGEANPVCGAALLAAPAS
jgi:hypothetical protein